MIRGCYSRWFISCSLTDKVREVLNQDEEMKNLPRLLMVELLEQYLFSKEGKPPTALEDVLDVKE